MMAAVFDDQRKRIHPHKFIMWIVMGSVMMMFAGFTSAYVVKRSQSNWLEFRIPAIFWYSTAIILLSSLTLHLAGKAFRAREMGRYKALITTTALLGVAFVIMQWKGFGFLEEHGVKLIGTNSNPAGSFLGVIMGVHMLHVLGGVIALLVMLYRVYSGRRKNYSTISIEVASTYWHFVDGLWIYLFIFFNYMSS
jgi:cytochrome c oxidase subunit 3